MRWIAVLLASVGSLAACGQAESVPREADLNTPTSAPTATLMAEPSTPTPLLIAKPGTPTPTPTSMAEPDTPTATATLVARQAMDGVPIEAEVINVLVSGEERAYSFSVTVSSPDTGCEEYVDWWEVVTPDGAIVYRHTLLHSHVDEQPFTRFGGPVAIEANADVIVRAHMNTEGYGVAGLRGSVAGGFAPTTLRAGFAESVESLDPQPPECAF